MKNSLLQKIFIICLPGLLSVLLIHAQIATWSFNNILTGTGTANSIPGNASLGSTIAAGGAFNGGTVYYGEGSWPGGVIDPNAYLEFSITPSAGHTLTITSLAMQIRRSTTGVSGAGPNNWALRSSLDAYGSNISSGVLTTNSLPVTTVMLGVAFLNLPAKITFRLYGYNATVSSGGLNRFVYDDIVANGSTVLPMAFDYFKVHAGNQSATISWKLGGEGVLSTLNIERAKEGADFEQIKTFSGEQLNTGMAFAYTDQMNNPSGVYAYRIQMISPDGQISYSGIEKISFESVTGFHVQPINTGSSLVSFRVNATEAGNYVFSLYNLNGSPVAVKPVQLSVGTQTIQMDNRPLKSGIYILLGENTNQKISTKIMVL
jgi:hypothetical protein